MNPPYRAVSGRGTTSGYDTSKFTDEQMEDLASDLGNAYRENTFWIDLEALVPLRDDLPKQKTLTDY